MIEEKYYEGIVKKFFPEAWGILTCNDLPFDIFFYYKDVHNYSTEGFVMPGDRVRFLLVPNHRKKGGFLGKNIQRI